MKKFKLINETPQGIQFEIDSIRYNLGPKGHVNKDGKLDDHCIIIEPHLNTPAVQAFLICNPAKIRVESLDKTIKKEDASQLVDSFNSTLSKKMSNYTKEIDTIISSSIQAFRVKIEEYDLQFNKLKDDLTELSDVVSKLNEEISNIKVPKIQNKQGNKTKKSGNTVSGTTLFKN